MEELARRHSVRVVSQHWPGFPSSGGPAGVELETVPISRWHLLARLVPRQGRPLQVSLHHHRVFHEAVRRQADAFRPDVAVLVLSRLGDALAALDGLPVVVDLVDALALNMRHRAQRQPRLDRLWTWEAQRVERWDRGLIGKCAAATVVSRRDRRALVGDDETLGARVNVLPYGLRLTHEEPLAVARQPIVALTGNLGYFPTVDGARWFAERVWPQIRQLEPSARWWLAGARPPRSIRRLERLPGARVFADPEDLGSIAHRAAVAVAPLRSGSGTPIKILEAMAGSVPVVSTGTGSAGLDDLPEHAVCIADEPEAFARAVVTLLRDHDLAYRTALTARRWLRSRHDLELVAAQLEAILERAVAGFDGTYCE